MFDYDVILLGGGLANSLIAWQLRLVRPELTLLLIEQGMTLGGNHTWSFYDSDVMPEQLQILQPFIETHWPAYDVKFPSYTRRVETGYNSISSDRLHQVIMAAMADSVRLGTIAAPVSPTEVQLQDGSQLTAPLIIDGRGWQATPHLALAYQKFVGLEVRLTAPHGLYYPIIMDACVPQLDGFRFVYCLPFAVDRLLIEDTRYSGNAQLDGAAMQNAVKDYAAAQGWQIAEIIRTESGILPITLAGDFTAFWRNIGSAQPTVGLRAGLFHATTGYSLPDAVRIAGMIAAVKDLTSPAIARLIRNYARQSWHRQRFFRILNRMLFLAAKPELRFTVLQRFYRLPPKLIARFYAGRLHFWDKVRILSGKPPVSVWRALCSLPSRSAQRAVKAKS